MQFFTNEEGFDHLKQIAFLQYHIKPFFSKKKPSFFTQNMKMSCSEEAVVSYDSGEKSFLYRYLTMICGVMPTLVAIFGYTHNYSVCEVMRKLHGCRVVKTASEIGVFCL